MNFNLTLNKNFLPFDLIKLDPDCKNRKALSFNDNKASFNWYQSEDWLRIEKNISPEATKVFTNTFNQILISISYQNVATISNNQREIPIVPIGNPKDGSSLSRKTFFAIVLGAIKKEPVYLVDLSGDDLKSHDLIHDLPDELNIENGTKITLKYKEKENKLINFEEDPEKIFRKTTYSISVHITKNDLEYSIDDATELVKYTVYFWEDGGSVNFDLYGWVKTYIIEALPSMSNLIIHCRMGIGRTMTTVAMLIVHFMINTELKFTEEDLQKYLRCFAWGSIETKPQLPYIKEMIQQLKVD